MWETSWKIPGALQTESWCLEDIFGNCSSFERPPRSYFWILTQERTSSANPWKKKTRIPHRTKYSWRWRHLRGRCLDAQIEFLDSFSKLFHGMIQQHLAVRPLVVGHLSNPSCVTSLICPLLGCQLFDGWLMYVLYLNSLLLVQCNIQIRLHLELSLTSVRTIKDGG